MKCSFGVASCARISSAMIPPATKKARLVAMYRIPIRLWSVVVTHEATRPWYQGTGNVSALAATTAAFRDVRLRVLEERVHLRLRPAVADGRHPVPAVADDGLERAAVGEDRAALERRAVVAGACHAVALRARAPPDVAPQAGGRRRPGADPRLVLVRREDADA